ncbi:MAG: ribose 5-phosphate isomerase B [Candidatus Fermentibacteraceae bacterium]|nr:ribose 5-phosphate isomerase B [Candidatus Fermentibacteraceae bacterium]MBN2607526.1 ribose 5-phosphate isomerase B [Candidatus Fermentibacteraceae bacterium]
MKLAIASDHAGFPLKEELLSWLTGLDGVEPADLGPENLDSVDYPDYAGLLCRQILSGDAERGILICNSGIGMSMSANRYIDIRAALCLYPDMAYWARHHNNANVLVLGGGVTAPFLAREIVEVFLREPFDGGRHERRVCKMDSLPGDERI